MEAAQLESAIKALEAAVKVAGSQSALGRVIGVTQRAVWRWVSEAKPLPPQHVLVVEGATGISRHDLRPDIYPREQGIIHIDDPAPGTRHHFTTAPERAR